MSLWSLICMWYGYRRLRLGVQGLLKCQGRPSALKSKEGATRESQAGDFNEGMPTGRYYLACCPMGNLRFFNF